MPPVTRISDLSTGHDDCPPQPAVSGEENFTVSGKPVVREGDRYAEHGCRQHAVHSGYMVQGAPSMSVSGHAAGRVGDPISCGGTAYEGETSFTIGDKGGEEQRLQAWETLRENLREENEEEMTLLCLPDIAEAHADRESRYNDADGWRYLARFHREWILGAACDNAESNPKALWVDMDWLLSYLRVQRTWDDFTSGKIRNKAAKETLAAILRRDGYLASIPADFDYLSRPISPSPGKRPWQYWKDAYFQSVPVNTSGVFLLDGLSASMGGFTFRALAAGHVEPLKEGGHRITVQRVGVLVWDAFNFEGDDFLAYWNCREKDYSVFGGAGYVYMGNRCFQDFRRKYGRGGDFMVFAGPRHVEDFQEFSYDVAP